MKKSFFALNSLKKEISKLNGIIFLAYINYLKKKYYEKKYLIFLSRKEKNLFALEDIELKDLNDMQEIENIFFISKNSKKI